MQERLKQVHQTRLAQGLSQQQVRFVRLLEMNSPELDDAVARELEDNPALETRAEDPGALTDDGQHWNESAEQLQRADYYNPEDAPAMRSNAISQSDQPHPLLTPADTSESLYDFLERQLPERRLPERILTLASYIIASLDTNGYLRRPLASLADDFTISRGEDPDSGDMEEAFNVVRSLDPAGVGATDLRDCLMLQLARLDDSQRRDDSLNIVRDHFEAFAMKHSHRIISTLKISRERLEEAYDLIRSLNPKPGASVGSGAAGGESHGIVPDFIIEVEDEDITITLNNNIPELTISAGFESAAKELEITRKNKAQRKGNEFILSRYADARDFIRLISQRQQTLFAVMTAIVEIQRQYLLTEDEQLLQPMALKDIAAKTGYDVSVVSRATNNKSAQLPWGVVPLRFFFSESFRQEGDEISGRNIEAAIRAAVESEDKRHPLSDDAIHKQLTAQGYDVSRRTIAKYRDRLKIPVARLRREM